MIFEAKYINTVKGRDAYVEAKTKATDEYSFAFYVTDFDYDDEGVRNVLEVAGIDEISQVDYGMDPKTRQIEVNNKELTIRDAEKALKNVGFSEKIAKKILSEGFNSCSRDVNQEQRDAEKESNSMEEYSNILNDFNNFLEGVIK